MLLAVNVYAERTEGEVSVWLAISQADGKFFAFSLAVEDAEQLHQTLGEKIEAAHRLSEQHPER